MAAFIQRNTGFNMYAMFMTLFRYSWFSKPFLNQVVKLDASHQKNHYGHCEAQGEHAELRLFKSLKVRQANYDDKNVPTGVTWKVLNTAVIL